MKKSTILYIAPLLLLLTASCKKETVPPPSGTPKLSKIEFVGSNSTRSFTYNSEGRLTKLTHPGYEINYTPEPYGFETINSSKVKEYGISNAKYSNGRFLSFVYSRYNPDGSISWSDLNSLEYDAGGYQIKRTYSGFVYTSEVKDGNTTSQTITNTITGSTRAKQIEYYTDKPNKLNLSYFENWCLDHFLSDVEITGKWNRNLPKKLIENSASYSEVTDFVYLTDANGLVTQANITYTRTSKPGGATTIDTYVVKFSYF